MTKVGAQYFANGEWAMAKELYFKEVILLYLLTLLLYMPGANCVFPQCGTNRREKYDGIGIFRISQRKSPFYSAWREDVISIIKKYRVVDENLKRQIEFWNISICEKHYIQEDIEFTSKLIKLKITVNNSYNMLSSDEIASCFRTSPVTSRLLLRIRQ